MTIRKDKSLNQVINEITQQAARVEKMLHLAIAILDGQQADINPVTELEKEVNEVDIEIENSCLELLVLQRPVAVDLRTVAAVIKINGDLERIADLALNAAKRANSVRKRGVADIPAEISRMTNIALEMLRDADKAFVDFDLELAREVCRRDDEVDALNNQLIRIVIAKIKESPEQTEGLLHLFSLVRIIERIADHATNIAEDVEFLVSGQINRHAETKGS